MTVTVVWREGMHFCTTTPSGQLMCDESSEVGAAYPSAPELLMGALGSCIGSALVSFADLPDQRRQTLERVAHACLIHNTLTHPPQISLRLTGSS